MRFQRYIARSSRAWTPARLRAAERAVQREKAVSPMFPELARFQTVQDRVKHVDAEEEARIRSMREYWAWAWREGRRRLREMERVCPVAGRCCRSLWSRDRLYPADPVFLLGLTRETCRRWGVTTIEFRLFFDNGSYERAA